MGKVKFWTPEEDAIIRKNYHSMTDCQLTALLPDRTAAGIQAHRINDLHIKHKIDNRFIEPFTGGPSVPPGYRGSYPVNPIKAKDIKHIDLLRRVYGTYGGAR